MLDPLAHGRAVLASAVVALCAALIAPLGAEAASSPCPVAVNDGRCVPDDPRFDQLWRLDNQGQTVAGKTGVADADVDAPEAWAITHGSPDVTIAVVDTGVAYDHPDLAPNIWQNPGETGSDAQGADRRSNGIDDDANGFVDDWRGWDFADNDNDPRDKNLHGTHVAAIAGGAGNDGNAVVGLAWGARIMPVRALGFQYETTAERVAAAFDYAADNGARIVNFSDGLPEHSDAIKAAIDRHPGVLFMVAAGNSPGVSLDSPGNDEFPCEEPSPNIVCVASTDSTDAKSSFSKWGPQSVDLGAPGGTAVSAVPARAQVWSDSFEFPDSGVPDDWTAGAANGSPVSQWGVSGANTQEGAQSVTDSPSGELVRGSNTWLETSGGIDLSGQEGCRLSYALTIDSQTDVDRFYVQGRPDDLFADYTPGDPDQVSTVSGTLPTVAGTRDEDLSGLDGAADARLRIGLLAPPFAGAPGHDGAYVDAARIRCLSSSYSAHALGDVDVLAGTSMAAPLVAGAAALVWSEHPGFTAAEVKQSVLAGVDRVPALDHRTVTGGRLNAYGALKAADRVAAGPVSEPPAQDPPAQTSPVITPAEPTSAPPAPVVARPATPARTPAKAPAKAKRRAKPKAKGRCLRRKRGKCVRRAKAKHKKVKHRSCSKRRSGKRCR